MTFSWRTALAVLYFLFLAASVVICYRRAVTDDFDRYIYEAIVRAKYQPYDAIYPKLKHSEPRAERSSVMNSAEHMAQLEPMYAIRPLYLQVIAWAYDAGQRIQPSINALSAVSMGVLGIVLFLWTRQPLYCAAIMATQGVTTMGRMGTPDAFSTMIVLAGVCALAREKLFLGVLLLLVSIYARTDNVIFVIALLAWLLAERKLALSPALVLALLAAGSVFFINHFSGNYGWRILFRHSFLPHAAFPAEVAPHLSLTEYIRVLAWGCVEICTRFAPWAILSIAAWSIAKREHRHLLYATLSALVIHFLLFPSPQDRYYVWAYVTVAAIFVVSFTRLQTASPAAGASE